MSPVDKTPASDEALRTSLQSQLSPTILNRLDEVRKESKLCIRDILTQAIDFAWHVQMSGELDCRPDPSDGRAERISDPPNRYNGWENYETWCVHLWLSNAQGTYNHCCDLARHAAAEAPECAQVTDQIWTIEDARKFLLADRLKEYVEEMNPLTDGASVFTDLINAAISEVNWHEVSEAFLDDVADSDSVP